MQTLNEEKYPNWTAVIIAILTLALLIFIFILIKIITPIPPFPESASSEGMEINYGIYNAGTGNIEQNQIGEATDVIVKEKNTSTQQNQQENTYTSENGEDVNIPQNNNKIEMKEKTTVIHPTEVKPKSTAEILSEKFNKTKGKSGGDGETGQAGNQGNPEGNPFTHGKGGTGNNPDGTNIGSGAGKGNAPFGFDLKGRAVLYHPPLPSDTKEEGIVVVDIKVDKEGNVIDADPNGRGTTTTSPILKAKARQFALQIKFTPNPQFEEQKGSITIIFSFK